MSVDDNAALILRMQADLTKLDKDLVNAGVLADKSVRDIEDKFAKTNPHIPTAAMEGLFIGAGVAVSTFIGQGIGSLSQALVDVQKQLVQVADTAKLIGSSTDRVQELQFAASIGGVSPQEFQKGIENIGRKMNDSVQSENELSRLFEVNNIKIKDRQGKLISVNDALLRGADLIRNAATEFDKIKIADMLGLSREWVQALEGGSGVFNAIAAEAQSAGAVIDSKTIEKAKEFQREWESATTRWSVQIKAALSEILPLLETLVSKSADLLQRLNEWSKRSVVAAKLDGGYALDFKEAQTALAVFRANGQEPSEELVKQYNDAAERMREAARAAPRSTPFRLEITKDKPGSPTVTPPPASGSKDSKDTDDAFERAQAQVTKRIAVINAETTTIGLNSEARDRARTVAQLEEAAKRANSAAGLENTQVTEAQRAVIDQLADKYYAAAAAAREAQEAQRRWSDMQQAFGSIALDGISGLINRTQSLSGALSNAASRLGDLVLQSALLGQGPLAGIFGASASNGNLGGIFGVLLGGIPKFAAGGIANQPSLFGEAGTEAAVPLPDGRSIPVDLRMPAPVAQPAAPAMTFAPVYSIDARGSQMDADQLRAILAENNTMLRRAVPGWVEAARGRQISSKRT